MLFCCFLFAVLPCLSASLQWTSPDVQLQIFEQKTSTIVLRADFTLSEGESVVEIGWFLESVVIGRFANGSFSAEPLYFRTLWWAGNGSIGIKYLQFGHSGKYLVVVTTQEEGWPGERAFTRNTNVDVVDFKGLVWTFPALPDEANMTYCVGREILLNFRFQLSDWERVNQLTWNFNPLDGSGDTVIATDVMRTVWSRNYTISPSYRDRIKGPRTTAGWIKIINATKPDAGLYTLIVQTYTMLSQGRADSSLSRRAYVDILEPNRSTSCVPGTRVEGNTWTVFQRRMNGALNFNRTWEEYKNGFGDESGEFWLGLEPLHQLVSKPPFRFELRVDMVNIMGQRGTAIYKNFYIFGSIVKYRLMYDSFAGGNAGDSLVTHRNRKFSTPDSDNDETSTMNCALAYGAGWWFNGCGSANLNGIYEATSKRYVMWTTYPLRLKRTEMKIRPVFE